MWLREWILNKRLKRREDKIFEMKSLSLMQEILIIFDSGKVSDEDLESIVSLVKDKLSANVHLLSVSEKSRLKDEIGTNYDCVYKNDLNWFNRTKITALNQIIQNKYDFSINISSINNSFIEYLLSGENISVRVSKGGKVNSALHDVLLNDNSGNAVSFVKSALPLIIAHQPSHS